MATHPSQTTIEFALLENGLDSAHYALERLAGSHTKRDLKHAVLFLAGAVELVIKERLRQQDWKLLFVKPQNATIEAYSAGDFKSVGLDTALERLRDECGVELEEQATKTLKSFRSKRNKLEHFGIVDSFEAVLASTAQTLGILLDFIADHVDPNALSDADNELLDDIRAKTREFSAYVAHRMSEISEDLSNAYGLSTCPSCLLDTLTLGDLDPKCRFCGYHSDGEEVARRFVANVLQVDEHRLVSKGGDPLQRACPECGAWSLVIDYRDSGNQNPNPQEAVCLSCGEGWAEGELDTCIDCNELFDSHGGEMLRCMDCLNEYVGRDNT